MIHVYFVRQAGTEFRKASFWDGDTVFTAYGLTDEEALKELAEEVKDRIDHYQAIYQELISGT